MGREQRTREAMSLAQWERTIGDVQPFGVNAECPKCGAMQRAVNWCPGKQLDLSDDAVHQPCPFIGQHLHVQCSACNAVWLTRTLDDDQTPPEIRVRVNVTATLAAVLLRLDGKADIPIAELEAALKFRIGAAALGDGLLRVTAVPPEGVLT